MSTSVITGLAPYVFLKAKDLQGRTLLHDSYLFHDSHLRQCCASPRGRPVGRRHYYCFCRSLLLIVTSPHQIVALAKMPRRWRGMARERVLTFHRVIRCRPSSLATQAAICRMRSIEQRAQDHLAPRLIQYVICVPLNVAPVAPSASVMACGRVGQCT